MERGIVQTFVTQSDSNAMVTAILTAESLDPQRLGKQRVETKQILQGSFPHHPATKMWKGHEQALALYGHVICSEWIKRGFNDSLRPEFEHAYHSFMGQVREWIGDPENPESDDLPVIDWPWWFGHPHMVAAHRSKLLRKHPNFYEPKWAAGGTGGGYWADYRLPYIWPDVEDEGRFFLSKAEFKRIKEWDVPDWWYVSSDGEVTFA